MPLLSSRNVEFTIVGCVLLVLLLVLLFACQLYRTTAPKDEEKDDDDTTSTNVELFGNEDAHVTYVRQTYMQAPNLTANQRSALLRYNQQTFGHNPGDQKMSFYAARGLCSAQLQNASSDDDAAVGFEFIGGGRNPVDTPTVLGTVYFFNTRMFKDAYVPSSKPSDNVFLTHDFVGETYYCPTMHRVSNDEALEEGTYQQFSDAVAACNANTACKSVSNVDGQYRLYTTDVSNKPRTEQRRENPIVFAKQRTQCPAFDPAVSPMEYHQRNVNMQGDALNNIKADYLYSVDTSTMPQCRSSGNQDQNDPPDRMCGNSDYSMITDNKGTYYKSMTRYCDYPDASLLNDASKTTVPPALRQGSSPSATTGGAAATGPAPVETTTLGNVSRFVFPLVNFGKPSAQNPTMVGKSQCKWWDTSADGAGFFEQNCDDQCYGYDNDDFNVYRKDLRRCIHSSYKCAFPTTKACASAAFREACPTACNKDGLPCANDGTNYVYYKRISNELDFDSLNGLTKLRQLLSQVYADSQQMSMNFGIMLETSSRPGWRPLEISELNSRRRQFITEYNQLNGLMALESGTITDKCHIVRVGGVPVVVPTTNDKPLQFYRDDLVQPQTTASTSGTTASTSGTTASTTTTSGTTASTTTTSGTTATASSTSAAASTSTSIQIGRIYRLSSGSVLQPFDRDTTVFDNGSGQVPASLTCNAVPFAIFVKDGKDPHLGPFFARTQFQSKTTKTAAPSRMYLLRIELQPMEQTSGTAQLPPTGSGRSSGSSGDSGAGGGDPMTSLSQKTSASLSTSDKQTLQQVVEHVDGADSISHMIENKHPDPPNLIVYKDDSGTEYKMRFILFVNNMLTVQPINDDGTTSEGTHTYSYSSASLDIHTS